MSPVGYIESGFWSHVSYANVNIAGDCKQKESHNMKRNGFTLIEPLAVIAIIGILAAVVLVLFLSANVTAAEGPNIVFIMADDFGVGSVGCYGAPAELVSTPAIDRLAREGVRFTDASTPASICSSTRYGVLMGRYPWRTTMKFGVVKVNGPLLPDPKRTSMAKWLQDRGYTTAAIGKWHLGYGSKPDKTPQDWTGVLKPQS